MQPSIAALRPLPAAALLSWGRPHQVPARPPAAPPAPPALPAPPLPLQLFPEAAAELGRLGDLDGPANAVGSGASPVPFALRFLRADLPALAGQQRESVSRFQSLLAWTQQRAAAAKAMGGGDTPAWRRRRGAVARALAARLCRQGRGLVGAGRQDGGGCCIRTAPRPSPFSAPAHALTALPAAPAHFTRASAAWSAHAESSTTAPPSLC